MSDAYRLFALQPINVQGKGEVAPVGHISESQRAMMEAAQRLAGPQVTRAYNEDIDDSSTSQDPWSPEEWGALR